MLKADLTPVTPVTAKPVASDFARALDAQRAAEDVHRELAALRPEDYRCGTCLAVKPSVKLRDSWKVPLCNSCLLLLARGKLPRKVTLPYNLITTARDATGLTQSRFASLCGWSQPRQATIEASKGVLMRTFLRMANVFTAFDRHIGQHLATVISDHPELVTNAQLLDRQDD